MCKPEQLDNICLHTLGLPNLQEDWEVKVQQNISCREWQIHKLIDVYVSLTLLSFSPGSEFGSGLVQVEDVRAGGDGGHGPDSSVEFPPAAERRDRRRAQQETRQQGEERHSSSDMFICHYCYFLKNKFCMNI